MPITLQTSAHDGDSPAHLPAGEAPPGARAPGCGAASGGDKGSPHEDSPSNDRASDMKAMVMDALGGVASLAGASRALAAPLVRAGALGAAMSLAQRAVLAHAGEREREDSAVLAARHMQEVLRAVVRHVTEVRTPYDIPTHKSRWQLLLC